MATLDLDRSHVAVVVVTVTALLACSGSDVSIAPSTGGGGSQNLVTSATETFAFGGANSATTGGTESATTGGTESATTGGTESATTGGTESATTGGTESAAAGAEFRVPVAKVRPRHGHPLIGTEDGEPFTISTGGSTSALQWHNSGGSPNPATTFADAGATSALGGNSSSSSAAATSVAGAPTSGGNGATGGAPVTQTLADAGLADTTFFVSPDTGDDEGIGTEESPFRTIERARDTIRALGAARSGPITVMLRGGRYGLSSTLALDARDSGNVEAPITYQAYPTESPVLSGGIPITDWVVDEKNRWIATVPPGVRFRQLYVDGRHAQRARGPAPTVSATWGPGDIWAWWSPAGYLSPSLDLARWQNPTDIEFGYFGTWSHKTCPIADLSIDSDNDGVEQVRIAMMQPCLYLALHQEGNAIGEPAYIENALELLDEPGEWYHDRAANTLYYLPLRGQQPETTEVVVPLLERLLDIQGTIDAPVHDLVFRGITFAHATWNRPSIDGHVDVQANFTLDSDQTRDFVRGGAIVTLHNEYLKSPAAVSVSAGQSITFERCTFTQLGSAGLDLENGARANEVIGSRFFGISGSGIQVGNVLEQDHHPDDPRLIVKGNVIANNYLHSIGVDFEDSVAVFVGYTDGTVIAHNEIEDLPYTAVSVGWGWGEEDVGGGESFQPFVYTTPTSAANNRIEHNHIHNIMQKRTDGGGVYTLGDQPNTVIRANYIYDGVNGCGVYLDQGSASITVTENLLERVSVTVCLNNGYFGRDQTCSFHDNFDDRSNPGNGAQWIADAAGIQPDYQDILNK